MKHTYITLFLALLLVRATAADSSPPELAAARTRYEAALASATKPVRDKYLIELQQIKNRAMTMKNLDLAVAIDRELKQVGGPSATGVAPTADTSSSGRKLADMLPETKWESENDGGTLKSITFTGDGRIFRVPKSGASLQNKYELGKDGETVTFTKADGNDESLRFSRDRQSFTLGGTTFKISKRK